MGEKADSDLVRRQNRRIFLQALRQRGPLARIELGRQTGLSPASITSISSQLIDEGLVQEVAETGGSLEPVRRGRPLVRLDLNPDAARIVVVKLSIDGIELALADFGGRIVTREIIKVAVYDADPRSFGNVVATEVGRFLDRHKVKRRSVMRIAVAVQGLADSKAGTIVWSPAFSARNIQVCAPITRALGIDCTIANDANMIGEGLISIDPARYGGTSVVIFMGYGVGMGLIINGAVYHGATGAAAEFGHMNHVPGGPLCRCGRRGCIEAYAADYAIERAAEGDPMTGLPKVSPVSPDTMGRIERAALAGDFKATRAFQMAGEALGYGIARLIAVLSPEHIMLAGPGTRAMALIEPSLRRAMDDGVVDALRRNADLDVVPLATDMIIQGTIDESLRHLERDILAAGPPYAQPQFVETSA
jgi:predicted NBD/HSP70 family sugar kinase